MENRKISTKKESKVYRRHRNRIEALEGGINCRTISSEVLVLETSYVRTKISGKGIASSSSTESLKEGSSTQRNPASPVGVTHHIPPNLSTDKTSRANGSRFNPRANGYCNGRNSGAVGDLMHATANPTRDKSEPNSCQFNQYAGGDDGRSSSVADISRSCTDLKLTADETRNCDEPSSISTEKGKCGKFWNCTRKQEFVITTRSGDGLDGSLDPMGLFSEKGTSLGDSGNGATLQKTGRSAGCSDARGGRTRSVPCTTVSQNVQDEPDSKGVGPIRPAEANLEDNESSPRTQKVENILDQSGSEVVESGNIRGDVQTDANTAILNHCVDIRLKRTVQKLVHFFESLDQSPEITRKERAQRSLKKFEGVYTRHSKIDQVEHYSNSFAKETSRDVTETQQLHIAARDPCNSERSFKDSVKLRTSGISSTSGRGSEFAETMVNPDPLSTLSTTPSGQSNRNSNGTPFGKTKLEFIDIESSNAGYKFHNNSLQHSEIKRQLHKTLRMRNDAIQIDVENSKNESKLELKLEKSGNVESGLDSGYSYSVPHLKQGNALKICVFWRRCACVVCFLSILLSSSAFLNVLNF